MTDFENSTDEEMQKIKIFSNDDEKIKSVGEILSNESSRIILQSLLDEELTANEISNKLLISLQLVTYHLKKMRELGFVVISKVTTNSKGHDMKYYTATNLSIVIVPSSISKKAKESKLLVRSFRSIYRFAGIGVAGIVAWFSTLSVQVLNVDDTLNENTRSMPIAPSETSKDELLDEAISATPSVNDSVITANGFGDLFFPVIITSSVILIGVIIEIIIRIRLRKFNSMRIEK